MARIAGITLPNNKRVEYGLTAIFGIGLTTSQKILKEAGIDFDTRIKDLTDEQANALREIIEKNHRVEGDLRSELIGNIKRLKETGSYRGYRHSRHLPVRGQRTKTNSRTVRSNTRRGAGSGRRGAPGKT